MNFLSITSALIAAGITVPLLVSLYFLKLRRKRMDISSTLLWKKAIQDMQVNSPFQRLRKSLLLLLQLLLLAALLLAFARPTKEGLASQDGDRVVIVIDQSASMNVSEGGTTRLERAKDEARALINQMVSDGKLAGGVLGGEGGGGGGMVVGFGSRARVLEPMTSDPTRLRRAVDGIEATDGVSRLSDALRLVEPLAVSGGANDGGTSGENVAGGGLDVIVISDGKVSEDEALLLRGATVRYVKIGRDDVLANVGFVGMSARRDFENPERVAVFGELQNSGDTLVETGVTLLVDGRVQKVSRVSIPGGGGKAVVQFEVRLMGAGMVELVHDVDDALAADNRAGAGLEAPRDAHVLVVTKGNGFLVRVLEAVGAKRVVVMSPEDFAVMDPDALRRVPGKRSSGGGSGGGGFDLIVFDGVSPAVVPAVDSVYFGAAPPIDGLRLIEWEEGRAGSGARTQVVLDWRREEGLLRYVALDDLVMDKPGRLVVPSHARILVTGQSGPIMAMVDGRGDVGVAGGNAGARVEGHVGGQHLVASFGLLRSVWPIQVSFAVFMTNVLEHMGHGSGVFAGGGGEAIQYRVGEVAAIPVRGDARALTYQGEAGGSLDAVVENGVAMLPAFSRSGVYGLVNDADDRAGVVAPWERIAVNVLDANESDLKPAAALRVGATADTVSAAPPAVIRREIWRYFAWGALVVMLLEWVVYTRRMHL